MEFSKLIKPELEEIIESANFTQEEESIFKLLGKGKSITEISMTMHVCQRTIDRKIRNIKAKVRKLEVLKNGNNNT